MMFETPCVSDQDAISMIRSIPDAEEAAKRLTEQAMRKGSADNITCIVVRFNNAPIESTC